MQLSEVQWSDSVVVRRIAQGGMASVFLVDRTSPGFKQRIVVKTLLDQFCTDQAIRELFTREAARHASLAHPQIVQLLDFGRDPHKLSMALEYVSGGNLVELAHSVALKDTREVLAKKVIRNIGSALSTVHKTMIHGDISPGNILYGADGSFKLCDFGLARDLAAGGDFRELTGTIRYMAPEQITQSHPDIRSDIFSLGITVAEFYCGKRLYGDLRPDQLVHLIRSGAYLKHVHVIGLPPSLYDVILRAVQPSPSDRFQSAHEMLESLSCQHMLAFSPKRSSLDPGLPAAASLRVDGNSERSKPMRVGKLAALLSLILTLPTLLFLPLVMLWRKRS